MIRLQERAGDSRGLEVKDLLRNIGSPFSFKLQPKTPALNPPEVLAYHFTSTPGRQFVVTPEFQQIPFQPVLLSNRVV